MSLALLKAEKYLADPSNLMQQFKANSFTADLESLQVFDLDGAGTVKVQSNSYTGSAQNYNGYGSVSTAGRDVITANTGWITYALNQKKYYPMPIDEIESEESLNTFISRVNGLLYFKVSADVDTYRLSKLSAQAGQVINGQAGSTGNLSTDINGLSTPADLTTATILPTIETAIAKMAEEEVGTGNYKLYLTPATARLLEQADKLTHFINSREVDKAGASVSISYIKTSYGSADIKVIPNKYFHSFTAGTNVPGANDNVIGTELDSTFRFLLLAKEAVNAVTKVQNARIIPNGRLAGFDGNLFEMFLYYDIFIIERHQAVGTADGTTLLTPTSFNGVIKCKFEAA